MNINKYLLISIVLFLGIFGLAKYSRAACIGSHPTFTCDCSDNLFVDITNLMAGANFQPEDTINVTAGTSNPSSTVTITTGVKLIGAGRDSTTINCSNSGPCIWYQPESPITNHAFRISGFTINQDVSGIIAFVNNSVSAAIQTKIRIDHNKLIEGTGGGNIIGFRPGFYGVVDSNIVQTGSTNVFRAAWAADNGEYALQHFLPVIFGATDNNLYFEDNDITVKDGLGDGQYGNRYAYRYNTIIITGDQFPLLDMHGNYGLTFYGSFGGEVYGNKINEGYFFMNGLDARGGRFVWFFNQIIGNYRPAGGVVREEHCDADSPLTYYPPLTGVTVQHINNTFFWGNRWGSNLLPMGGATDDCCVKNGTHQTSTVVGSDGKNYVAIGGPSEGWTSTLADKPITGANWTTYWALAPTLGFTPDAWQSGVTYVTTEVKPDRNCCYNGVGSPSLLENTDWYRDAVPFTGTGVGCGSTLPQTCTANQAAYWLTSQRNCSDLTGWVGKAADRTENISGSLYKCTASNTWTAAYTPLAYPHPLRTDCVNYPTLCDSGNSDSTPPAAPQGLTVQ